MKSILIITIIIGFLKFLLALKKGEIEVWDIVALVYAIVLLIMGLTIGFPE